MYPKMKTRWSQATEDFDEDLGTIYSSKKREILVDEGGLRYEEDGFMKGYEEEWGEELDFTDEDDFLELLEEELLM